MPRRENLSFLNAVDRFGETNATTNLSPMVTVAMVGSALAFSDQMVRALNAEFPDVSFRRVPGLEHLKTERGTPRLIVLECAAAHDLVEVVQALRGEFKTTSIAVAYQSTDSAAEVADRVATGAIAPPVGLIRNNASLDVWISIIRLLLCGENYIPFELVTPWHSPAGDPGEPVKELAEVPGPDPVVTLTPREMQVLPLIAQGKQNKEIAGALGLSQHTVKLHTHNIFVKLKVNNRTCAADWYRSFMRATRARGRRFSGSTSAS